MEPLLEGVNINMVLNEQSRKNKFIPVIPDIFFSPVGFFTWFLCRDMWNKNTTYNDSQNGQGIQYFHFFSYFWHKCGITVE